MSEDRRTVAPFSLEVGFATDVGKKRQRNEDSYAIYVPYPGEANPSGLIGLLLVADGMGGERAGDRASQRAAEKLRQWISSGAFKSWEEYAGDHPLEQAIHHAIQKVSFEIYQLGEEDPSIRGLGSTVVLAAVGTSRVTIGHLGDSRCYRVRGGRIERLTADHSWVEKQVEAGVLTPEEARVHPQRNVLTRSLGDAIAPEPDVTSADLRDGDVFVLCSDGLTGGLEDHDIEALCGKHESPQILAERLVALANERDGSDNITAVVGRCHQEIDDEITEELPRAPMGSEPPTLPMTSAPSRRTHWLPAAIICLVLGFLAGWFGQRWRAGALLDRSLANAEQYDYPSSREDLRELLGLVVDGARVDEVLELARRLDPAQEAAADQPVTPPPPASGAEASQPAPEELANDDEPPPDVELDVEPSSDEVEATPPPSTMEEPVQPEEIGE